MAEIAWTAEAQRWLEDIFEFIAVDDPDAAARVVSGICERAQVLVIHAGRSNSALRALPHRVIDPSRRRCGHSRRVSRCAGY